MLRAIERATRQVIEPMNLPTVDTVNALRIAKFKQRVTETVADLGNNAYRPIIEQLAAETDLPLLDIAAALASLAQGTTPLLLGNKSEAAAASRDSSHAERTAPSTREQPAARDRSQTHEPPPPQERSPRTQFTSEARPRSGRALMETFRIAVGSTHGVRPSNVVGAIANEAGIEGVHIGRVDIRDDHSFVDLPEGMPQPIFKRLQKVLVAGRELRITKVSEKPPKPPRTTERKMLTRRPTPGRPKKS
jgi:ATP-dependent RNA helicase DeaD